MKEALKKMQQIFLCQGGGTIEMVQGKIYAKQKELELFLKELKLE